MNSNKYIGILDKITAQIKELHSSVDDPMDEVYNNFDFPDGEKVSHKKFNQILDNFYSHLSKNGFKNNIVPKNSTTFNEIVWIIENNYQGNIEKGYKSALNDAGCEQYSLILILDQIFSSLKQIERRKHIFWIITSYIDPSDWETRKKLVELILTKYHHYLHPEIQKFSAAQLSRDLEGLILNIYESII